jgi:hypothetical protein
MYLNIWYLFGILFIYVCMCIHVYIYIYIYIYAMELAGFKPNAGMYMHI